MGLNRAHVHTVRLDAGVGAEALHVGDPVWGVLLHLQVLVHLSVDTSLHQVATLHHGSAMDIEERDLVSAKQELAIGILRHLLVLAHGLVAEALDLGDILAAGEHHTEEVTESLVKLDHFNAHHGGGSRVTGDQLDALVGVQLHSVLRDDARLGNHVTLGCLHDGDQSSIEVLVPLCLVIEVDHALLELHLLGTHGVAGAGHEWTQVVAVEAQVLRVGARLGDVAACVAHTLESVVDVLLSHCYF